MRKLSFKEIEELASRQWVRRMAVENFLMTMGNDKSIALGNLRLDEDLYNWNPSTVKAIRDGIELASKGDLKHG